MEFTLTKKQKLINKLYSFPKDLTYDEAKTILGMFGFEEDTKGHTSGSRVMFVNTSLDLIFRLHKPHPIKNLKNYQVKELIEFIKKLEDK